MRYTLILIVTAGILFSCNPKDEDAEVADKPIWSSKDTLIIWSVDAEKSIKKRLFRPEDSISLADPLTNGINELWPEAGTYIKGQRNDTLIVGLKNETWLTEKIGSDGAESFLSFASINLLEIKGVNHIYFDLTPGVHAAAETWEDQDFADWKEER